MVRFLSSMLALATVIGLGACVSHPAERELESREPDREAPMAEPKLVRPELSEPDPDAWIFAPQPRHLSFSGEWFYFADFGWGALGEQSTQNVPLSLWTELRYAADVEGNVEEMWLPNAPMTVTIEPERVPHEEGYELHIQPDGIVVIGHDAAGVFYGMMTMQQLARQARGLGALPCIQVVDWPDFPNRGIMLDVARDKVPTMESLYGLVDRMAEWKLNQFQLYTEHTFAYEGHEVVWQDASPMTPAQIRALDAYCRERYIELVPNQNSFGHMHRWLRHDEYAHLAEHPGSSDLCPVDPASIELLADLYSQLLPNFTSEWVNVGCDETFSLGRGRSREAVEQRGKGRVYLEFLLEIDGLVRQHGKRMQFWGDIILEHPELIPELPQDITAMTWGYEADHPFDDQCRRFAEAGIPFYVCPGTSSWNSLVGRTENALGNLQSAAENGLKHGAEGYLITDWGDSGHWQYPPVSYPGFVYGASLSWAQEANVDLDLARALNAHVFKDSAGVMGQLVLDLGNAYLKTGNLSNHTAFYGILQYSIEDPFDEHWLLAGLTPDNLQATLDVVDEVMEPLDTAQMAIPDAELVKDELRLGADMVRFASRLGLARAEAGRVGTSDMPAEARHELAQELRGIIARHRALWLERNRPGGLDDSVARFEKLLDIFEG